MTQEETAQVLGVSRKTVEKQVATALLRLAKAMAEDTS